MYPQIPDPDKYVKLACGTYSVSSSNAETSSVAKPEIKKGQFWRTRGGLKAEIFATDGFGDYPVFGRIFSSRDQICSTWNKNGYFQSSEHSYDLVEHWKDKLVVDWSLYSKATKAIAMDGNGRWHEFQDIPYYTDDSPLGYGVWIYNTRRDPNSAHGLIIPETYLIPKDNCPKFDGQSKDSLCIRPWGYINVY